MPKTLLKLSTLAVIIVCTIFVGRSAAALTVSPVAFEYDIAPGRSVQGTITLINESESAARYSIFAKNFIASGEEGAQRYLDEEALSGLASWVSADPAPIALEPKTSREIPFTISVPADAEPGGHYATIFFARGAGEVSGSGIGIAEQIGVLLLVRVPGNVREALEVDTFRVAGSSVMSRLPVTLELRMRNTGSVHERPLGTIDVRNMFGSVVARLDANPKRSAVLPGSVRRFTNGWMKAPIVDAGGFIAEARNELRNFGFGKYTASVNVAYGSRGENIASESVSFWIIPWRLIIIAVSMLIVIVVLIAIYNKMLVRAALRKARR